MDSPPPLLTFQPPTSIEEADARGWEGFVVRCGTCRFIAHLRFPFIERVTRRRDITGIVARLRCRSCGGRPDWVALLRMDYPLYGSPRSVTVTLKPGAGGS